jgi:hypothetical protein
MHVKGHLGCSMKWISEWNKVNETYRQCRPRPYEVVSKSVNGLRFSGQVSHADDQNQSVILGPCTCH